jgi:dTDP-4-dehydrorhamnose 3,5-epimerase-like enzyme
MNLMREIPIQFPQHPNDSLQVLEISQHLEFSYKRMYVLRNIPKGEIRGDHAHKALRQVFVAINGEFTLEVSNLQKKETVKVRHGSPAILIEPGLWRRLSDFSSDAICLVLASEIYNEDDYIRDYDEYRDWVARK